MASDAASPNPQVRRRARDERSRDATPTRMAARGNDVKINLIRLGLRT